MPHWMHWNPISNSLLLIIGSAARSTLPLKPAMREKIAFSRYNGQMNCIVAHPFSSSRDDSAGDADGDEQVVLPDYPTDCCGSGCVNCVWVRWAEQVCSQYSQQGPSLARAKILPHITDPSLKMFITMELDALERKLKADLYSKQTT